MMNFFQIATILITLSALFSYVNFQYIRMPAKLTARFVQEAAAAGEVEALVESQSRG